MIESYDFLPDLKAVRKLRRQQDWYPQVAQIKRSYQPSTKTSTLLSGLLAWWTLNEQSGNRADSSGNGKTMLQTGSITGAAGFGSMGNVSVWDGNNANYLATGTALFTSGSWTIAGWVLTNSLTAHNFFAQGPSGSAAKQRIFFGVGAHLSVIVDGVNTDAGAATISTGVWYHVAVTYDTVTVNGYLNGSGTPELSHARTADYTGVNDCRLGINTSTVQPLNGQEVGVGVWNRVLTSTEISNLYNGGNGVQYVGF